MCLVSLLNILNRFQNPLKHENMFFIKLTKKIRKRCIPMALKMIQFYKSILILIIIFPISLKTFPCPHYEFEKTILVVGEGNIGLTKIHSTDLLQMA